MVTDNKLFILNIFNNFRYSSEILVQKYRIFILQVQTFTICQTNMHIPNIWTGKIQQCGLNSDLCTETSLGPLDIPFIIITPTHYVPNMAKTKTPWRTSSRNLSLLTKSNLDKNKLYNYCPISKLSVISKIIECVDKSRLTDHLTYNKLLNPHQYSYLFPFP